MTLEKEKDVLFHSFLKLDKALGKVLFLWLGYQP